MSITGGRTNVSHAFDVDGSLINVVRRVRSNLVLLYAFRSNLMQRLRNSVIAQLEPLIRKIAANYGVGGAALCRYSRPWSGSGFGNGARGEAGGVANQKRRKGREMELNLNLSYFREILRAQGHCRCYYF